MVDDIGTMNLIEAAARARVKHFVLESSLGVGDSRQGLSVIDRFFLRRELGPKHRSESRLRESGMGFTILRPGRLLHGAATGDVVLTERGVRTTGAVSRADVARLMVAAPYTPEAHGRTFELVGRAGARFDPARLAAIAWRRPA
jgi:nucleoside-diphosphate-sugar epimerase